MDWFYHAPGEGRIGPLSADEMRRRYRERRIQRDTLVWREGLPEWQPLDRVGDELELHAVRPDASLPPPLPAAMPAPAMPAASRHARAAPPARRMNGCLIALLVAAGLAIPMLGVLAAIALPAYRDYTLRTRVGTFVEPRAALLRSGIEEAYARGGRCPADPTAAGLPGALAEGVRVGRLDDGRCAFEITVAGIDPSVDGRSILHIAPRAGGRWDCTGGDLPARYRTRECRAESGVNE